MIKFLLLLAVITAAAAMPETGIKKCFTCERGDSNDDCNGAHLDHTKSPHGNGTLHTCLMDNPTCFLRTKLNNNATGYKVTKGCMNLLECLKEYAWQWDDYSKVSCFFGNPNLGRPPLNRIGDPNAECLYCVTLWQQGYTNTFYDGSNEFLATMLPMPEPNNGWDDEIDTWEAFPERIVQVEPEGYVPADWGKSGAESTQFAFTLGFGLLALTSFIMH